MGKGIKGLILGGAVGAALGILYAPRAGKKTRALLAKKTDAVINSSAFEENKIFGEVAKTTKNAVEAGQNFFTAAQNTKIGEFTKGATEKSTKFFKDTANFVEDFAQENVKPMFSDKNEELRRKIDNARTKIATQVASNIETDSQPAPIEATSKKKIVNAPAAKSAAKPAAPKKVAVKKAAIPTKKVTVVKTGTSVKKASASSTATKIPAAKKTAVKKAAPKKASEKKQVSKKPATKASKPSPKKTAKKTSAKTTKKSK